MDFKDTMKSGFEVDVGGTVGTAEAIEGLWGGTE